MINIDTRINGVRKFFYLLILTTIFTFIAGKGVSQTMTIPAGSVIIDMGVTPQTINNALKPYGLVYALLQANVPVILSINPAKVKDGVDFTIGTRQFRGGPFIIDAQYITPAVSSLIASWQSQGVVTFTTTAPVPSVPIYLTKLVQPKWTMDKKNGSIAVKFFTNAGIPASAYGGSLSSGWDDPGDLDCCDDIFVMPHADPKWLTHGRLYSWNEECKGAIWLGCHAGSALENMYNPANISEQTNFLSNKVTSPGTGIILPVANSTNYSQNSLILWGNHGNGTPPYTFDNSLAADPVGQWIGAADLALLNGSEQIYLPVIGGSWRSTSRVLLYDATPVNAPGTYSDKAAVIVYGRGFGDSNRGYVMMEASHDISKYGGSPSVAAQRAFFNFSFLSAQEKAVEPSISGLPSVINSGQPYNLTCDFPAGANPANYTITWSSSCGGTFTPNANSASVVFTPSVSINPSVCNITVTIVDNCGRTTFDTDAVTVQCNFSVTSTVTNPCAGTPTGGAINFVPVNGTGPFAYSWTRVSPAGSGSGTLSAAPYSITGLTAGTYSVTITANGGTGCPTSFTTTLTASPAIVLSPAIVPVTCNGGSTGAINLGVSGGTPPFTYLWNDGNTGQNRSGLPAGDYSVTVTDSRGCTQTSGTITITQPAALTANPAITPVLCFGQNTGAIALNISGGTAAYTVLWNDGNTSINRTGLTAGTYSAAVTDANNCTYTTGAINVTQPASGLSLSETHVNVLCFGGSTGSIDLTVGGGTPFASPAAPYNYAWTKTGVPSFNANTQDLSGLSAGTYNVTVTDAGGCTASLSVVVTQPPALTLSTTPSQPSCPPDAQQNGFDGVINLNVSGGTPSFGYVWSATGGGGIVPPLQVNNKDLTGLRTGTYTVVVTDANGCTATTSVTLVAQNPNPVKPGSINH